MNKFLNAGLRKPAFKNLFKVEGIVLDRDWLNRISVAMGIFGGNIPVSGARPLYDA
jgi:hypothetical protein